MKGLLLVLLLSFPLLSVAQDAGMHTFSKDSALGVIDAGWRFADADRPELALPSFDDHALPLVRTERIAETGKPSLFRGIGWLRLHFQVDSFLAGKVLALQIRQDGASEIYLDGLKLRSYGEIAGKDSSEYYDPQSLPFTFMLDTPGEHLLAIRYANWANTAAGANDRNGTPGFRLTIAKANSTIENYTNQMIALSVFMMTLLGLFSALFLLHLLFFLYNRGDKSNLLFSLFSLSAALLFLMPLLLKMLSDPVHLRTAGHWSFVLIIVVFFSLSGFLNTLFSKKKLRFIIISICCAVTIALYFYDRNTGLVAMGIIIGAVAIESAGLIIAAIVRRKPGARIIGAGLLLLIVFLLFVLIMVVTTQQFDIDDTTIIGQILSILVVGSIISIPISLSAYLARNFAVVSKSLKLQLVQVQQLSQKNLEQEAEKRRLLQNRQQELEAEVAAATAEVRRQHEDLKVEKKKTDDLLLNILPEEVAEELKDTGASTARLYEHVSVLFTDFVDFTQHSEKLSPAALVAEIHECFKAFDGIIGHYGLEKIKTVGDAYIAVAGLPVGNEYHARQVISAAIAIRDFMVQRKAVKPDSFDIRLGVHSGPVVAGIVGVKKFAYDIWGDTVNTAARMEQSSEAGRINISAATYALAKEAFSFTYRGEIDAKHKGRMGMYFAEGKA